MGFVGPTPMAPLKGVGREELTLGPPEGAASALGWCPALQATLVNFTAANPRVTLGKEVPFPGGK